MNILNVLAYGLFLLPQIEKRQIETIIELSLRSNDIFDNILDVHHYSIPLPCCLGFDAHNSITN